MFMAEDYCESGREKIDRPLNACEGKHAVNCSNDSLVHPVADSSVGRQASRYDCNGSHNGGVRNVGAEA